MLIVRDLRAWYGPIEALHGISFEVAEGERVALVGSNRAGKTTTLRSISGVVKRAAAELSYEGNDLQRLPAHVVPSLGIAHVPEGRQVFAGITVIDNLLIGAHLKPSAAYRQERLEFVFAMFPRLAERRLQYADTMSGGEQQMLSIGRALMLSPSLLLLDEPSQGLAPRIVDEMYEALVRVAETGVTMLLVEQNISAALDFSTRAYVLENGSVALAGASSDLARDDRVRESYLGV